MEKFIEDCLNAHNHYRAVHGSQPLQINSKLNEYANVWATYLAKRGDVTRRKTMPYGENVYIVYKENVSRSGPVVEAVSTWYEENKYYKYGESQAENLKVVRHFTQLVWKSTVFMGLGMVYSPTGQIYVVCNYDPPGNVENEFAENVLPPSEDEGLEEKEEEEKEEEERKEEDPMESEKDKPMNIEYVQPKLDIVESMHRLYAVPSEKLRVWSIWLSQISDEAEIWQKWLRSYIDLIIRIEERLKELEEEDISVDKKSERVDRIRRIFAYDEDAIEDDGIDYPEGIEDFYDIEQVLADIVAGEEKSIENERKEDEETKEDERGETTSENVVNETEGKTEEEKRMGGGADQPEDTTDEQDTIIDDTKDQEEEKIDETKDLEEEEEEEEEVDETKDYLKEWPVGTQWEPFGIQEEEDRSDIIETIEVPKNVEEMRKLLKDFTSQATIYRSYFKHWLETSEKATKEIIGRTVMSTAKLHGILNEEDPDESLKLCMDYSKTDRCYLPAEDMARTMDLSERIGAMEFIKEIARADEKIPYFFYRKTEPDVEIAIKHDDEKVIPLDPEIEVIFGNYKSLRFNLNDKPGKS